MNKARKLLNDFYAGKITSIPMTDAVDREYQKDRKAMKRFLDSERAKTEKTIRRLSSLGL